MMRCLCQYPISVYGPHNLPPVDGPGTCTPVEMLRRVETLDEILRLGRPRRTSYHEGLAAEDLGVVDAQLRGKDLIAQPSLRAGVVVPCLSRFRLSVS